MIYEYFNVSDTDESILDLNEILKVELKNDNIQSPSTRCDETIISLKKQPDEEILDRLPSASTVRTAEAIDCGLCTFKILFKKLNRETTPDLTKTWWSDTWNRKNSEKHFSSRERQHEKPASGAAATNGKSKGKGK